MREVLSLLEVSGYITNLNLSNGNVYMLEGSLNDFEEMLKDKQKEIKKTSRREWSLAIVGVVVGAILTKLIDFIFSLF